MGSAVKRRIGQAALYVIAWTLLGLFYFSQAVGQKALSRDPTPWWHFLLMWLIGVYVCGFLSLGVLWLGRRLPFERGNWLRRAAQHLLSSVCFSFIDLAICAAVYRATGMMPTYFKDFGSTFVILLLTSFHSALLTYWTVLGIQSGLRYYRGYQERKQQTLRLELHASELKSQLARAQLSALKMQLQPHFLFNTLNAITVLVRQGKGELAEEMLARLSDLLRCVLEDVEAQEVPLRRELEYLRLYLSIQQVRFQDRLRIEISADPETLQAAVPQMVLQPIVENAVRHGIGVRSAASRLQIETALENRSLRIQVEDDGPGFRDSASGPSGIGLANTRARLRQLYGNEAQLLTTNCEEGGARVTLLIPYHLAPDAPGADLMEVHANQSADR
jgi:two-component system, LytTR family, sensor kinase